MAGLDETTDSNRADEGQGISESVVSIRSRAAQVLEKDSHSGSNDSQKSSVYQNGKQMMGSAKMQGDLWGRAPRGWAEIQEPMHRPLWEAMLNATEAGSGTRFLDAGCGGGGASILAAERGAQVSGLGAAEGLLAFGRQRVPGGDFRVGDIEQLPLTSEFATYNIMIDVLTRACRWRNAIRWLL